VLRADHLFPAAEVPPDSHRVVFACRPLSWSNLKHAVEMVPQ
jgi:hypothetical protein